MSCSLPVRGSQRAQEETSGSGAARAWGTVPRCTKRRGIEAGIQANSQAALRKQAVGNMAGGKRKGPCESVKWVFARGCFAMPGSWGESSRTEPSQASWSQSGTWPRRILLDRCGIFVCIATTCRNCTILSYIVAIDRPISKWLRPKVTSSNYPVNHRGSPIARTDVYFSCVSAIARVESLIRSFCFFPWTTMTPPQRCVVWDLRTSWCSDFVCAWPKHQLEISRTIQQVGRLYCRIFFDGSVKRLRDSCTDLSNFVSEILFRQLLCYTYKVILIVYKPEISL